MVVPETLPAYVELRSKDPPHEDLRRVHRPSPSSPAKRVGDKELLAITFQGRGQKSIRLEYGNKRWTNLHFYCVEDVAERLKARGKFIIEHEFYDNPSDPYHPPPHVPALRLRHPEHLP